MNTLESIQNKIAVINERLLSSIEDKTLFDDCFKSSIIHIKNDGYRPPTYKGRSIECPVFQKPFEYDVTKNFSKKSFNSFKKTVNSCILLDALYHLMIYDKLNRDGFNKTDNIFNKIFTTFAHKKNSESTTLFMETVKECDADINIYIIHVVIALAYNTNIIKYNIRLGTEIK